MRQFQAPHFNTNGQKNISSAENHREMLQRQQKGNQQQCLNDSKKKISL